VIGQQLKTNASQHTLHGSAPALIIGLILTLFGARWCGRRGPRTR